MGNGIVESGLGRTERLEVEQRTTDPSTTKQGEMWLRTDVAPETDQLATLRVDNGSGTWDVPVFDASATVDNVQKVFRVPVGGVTGFVPVTGVTSTFPKLRFQHGGSTLELHDALTASAIPDSAIHRWSHSEGSGTILGDSIGNLDGTINGSSWATGTWVDGYSLNHDGTDDGVTTSDPSLNLNTDNWTAAITIQAESAGSTQRTAWGLQWGHAAAIDIGADGDLRVIWFTGDNTRYLRWSGWSTGTKYRVVATRDQNTEFALWVNNTKRDSNDASVDASTSTNGNTFGFRGDGFNYWDGDTDDAILADAAWSLTEIADDYDRQPWS